MNLRQFLDAGYALLLEEYSRMGVPLQSALENMREWAAGFSAPETQETREKVEVVHQNEQAMAQLNAMMAQVKR